MNPQTMEERFAEKFDPRHFLYDGELVFDLEAEVKAFIQQEITRAKVEALQRLIRQQISNEVAEKMIGDLSDTLVKDNHAFRLGVKAGMRTMVDFYNSEINERINELNNN